MNIAVLLLPFTVGAFAMPLMAGDKWDQGRAKSMVAKVLEIEKEGSLPWLSLIHI